MYKRDGGVIERERERERERDIGNVCDDESIQQVYLTYVGKR